MNTPVSSAFFGALLLVSGAVCSRPAAWQQVVPAAPAATAAGQTPASAAPAQAEQRFVRAGAQGARLYNLKDTQAKLLAQLPAGSLLRVAKDDGLGWLEVENAGGVAVWIAGKYATLSEDGKWAEVSGDKLNLRPLPNIDKTNFPLARQVGKGTRLRVLERAGLSADLAQDWLRVWSPEGTTVYVQSSQTSALESGLDGAQAWREAQAASERPAPPAWVKPAAEPAAANAQPVPEVVTRSAPLVQAPQHEQPLQALSAAPLARARALFESERNKPEPDFAAVREAFGAIVTSAPQSEEARAAQDELVRVEAASIQHDLLREQERRLARISAEQHKLREAALNNDPFLGRFEGRGRLQRREQVGGVVRWYLQFGGKDAYEVECSSGRYCFDLFAGFELGVTGSTVQNERGLKRIDVARIEVLSQR